MNSRKLFMDILFLHDFLLTYITYIHKYIHYIHTYIKNNIHIYKHTYITYIHTLKITYTYSNIHTLHTYIHYITCITYTHAYIKASQARNLPDPGIMANGLVDEDLASRLASEELRS